MLWFQVQRPEQMSGTFFSLCKPQPSTCVLEGLLPCRGLSYGLAQLRTLGSCSKGSGIPAVWLFGFNGETGPYYLSVEGTGHKKIGIATCIEK